jgi:hypothetical protein
MLMIAIGLRTFQFAIGHWLPLLAAIPLAFVIYVLLSVLLLGGHATTSSGVLLGWRGSFRLAVFAFLLMTAFAVILLGVAAILHTLHPTMQSP